MSQASPSYYNTENKLIQTVHTVSRSSLANKMKSVVSVILPIALIVFQAFVIKLHAISLPSNNHTQAIDSKADNKTLRVGVIEFEPFVYQDRNSAFFRGIEFELIKCIAKNQQLRLSFEILLSPLEFGPTNLK